MKSNLHIDTILTTEKLGPYGAKSTPIYLSSAFGFKRVEDAADVFKGVSSDYVYGRIGNPTTDVFENKMAEIEGGEKGLAFASGMAAIHATIMSVCRPGDKLLCVEEVYGGTHDLLKTLVKDMDIHVSTFNPDLSNFPDTRKIKLLFVESPTNPSLHVVNLKKVWDLVNASKYRPVVCVDNTFATPIVQRPLEENCADLILHSCTKYVCGHGDSIGGVVVTKNPELYEKIKHTRTVSGGIMSPFVAFLCMRGLKTMGLRVQRHQENAAHLDLLFQKYPNIVKKIHYPGFGGMISIDLGTREKAAEFVSHLKIPVIAVSLGEVRTLINVPACMTHSTYSEEELKALNLSPGFVRVSTGIERPVDLVNDFEQALKKIEK